MARRTKYTYGQFASVGGKRYRVRKNKSGFTCRTKCALCKNERYKLPCAYVGSCIFLIPLDAYFEKV